jgi:death-on-curing protein
VEEAAALMESPAINHPFVDGNKRIAFAAVEVFLRINGWQLTRPPMQIHEEMLPMLESGAFDMAHIDAWLRGFTGQPSGESFLKLKTSTYLFCSCSIKPASGG